MPSPYLCMMMCASSDGAASERGKRLRRHRRGVDRGLAVLADDLVLDARENDAPHAAALESELAALLEVDPRRLASSDELLVERVGDLDALLFERQLLEIAPAGGPLLLLLLVVVALVVASSSDASGGSPASASSWRSFSANSISSCAVSTRSAFATKMRRFKSSSSSRNRACEARSRSRSLVTAASCASSSTTRDASVASVLVVVVLAHRATDGYPSAIALSIPSAKKCDAPSVHARRAARRRLRLDVDAVEQIVERALVDRDARRVAREPRAAGRWTCRGACRTGTVRSRRRTGS